jgi:hypothetical protein
LVSLRRVKGTASLATGSRLTVTGAAWFSMMFFGFGQAHGRKISGKGVVYYTAFTNHTRRYFGGAP